MNSLNRLLNKDVTVNKISRDFNGKKTSTELGVWKGHIEFDRKRITDKEGEEITVNSTVFIRKEATFTTDDDEYELSIDGRTHQAEQVNFIEDPRGRTKYNHWEVHCR